VVTKLLIRYKELTIKIMEELREDKDINILMEARGSILKEIQENNLSKEDLIEEYNELNIEAEDQNLGELIRNKLHEVKVEIDESKVRRNAYSSYSSANRHESLFAKKV